MPKTPTLQEIYSSFQAKNYSSIVRSQQICNEKEKIVALTGGVVGLLGILAGVIVTDNNTSDEDSDFLVATSAAMITAGSIATIVGFSFYMTGSSRINRINRIQFANSLRLELNPGILYSSHNHEFHPGLTLKMSF